MRKSPVRLFLILRKNILTLLKRFFSHLNKVENKNRNIIIKFSGFLNFLSNLEQSFYTYQSFPNNF